MTRPARVVIDLDALSHNLDCVRRFARASRVMAVVKADAYGHGIERVGKTLRDSDAFGVSCLEEAQQLRDAGIRQPIVLLEGPFHAAELDEISKLRLDLVLHSTYQVDMVERHRDARRLQLWVKVDSGMHRLGFDPDDLPAVWERIVAFQGSTSRPRLMTHLAQASRPSHPLTGMQLQRFAAACTGLPGERSVANSAAIVSCPPSHCDWVRPGLMLYGVSPLEDATGSEFGLRPAMSLESEIIAVRNVKAGEPVGYGAGWICPEDMPIGIVAAGYGDGFPRHARPGTPVLVGGARCSMVGFASMDMLTVDLRAAPRSRVGAAVELWGSNLPIEEIARHADTVPYELLCGVHGQRLSLIEYGQAENAVSVQ